MSPTDHRPAPDSAGVRMQLSVNGLTFAIGQFGPSFVTLRRAIDHPPADAEITLWIDGRASRWRVYLPCGIDATRANTPITNADSPLR